MDAFDFIAPISVDLVVRASALEGAVIKAGGIDLLDRMKNHLESPRLLVSLGNVKGLEDIVDDDLRGLVIGSRVTLADIAMSPQVRSRAPHLAEACAHVATPQVRNMATLGGNLAQKTHCWYFRSEHDVCRRKGGPTCFALEGENEHHALFGNKTCASVHASTVAPMLIALGAQLTLKSDKGSRELSLEDFYLAPEKDILRENVLLPGDVITEIRIPRRANVRTGYLKQQAKESFDWPLAVAAVALEMDGTTCKRAAVVLGAAAPIPWRARAAEQALMGKPLSESTLKRAAKAAMAAATPLSQNGYRGPLFEVVVRRALEQAAEAVS